MTLTSPPSPNIFSRAFVAKVNAAGVTQWAIQFLPTAGDESIGSGVGVDTAGNAYVVYVNGFSDNANIFTHMD